MSGKIPVPNKTETQSKNSKGFIEDKINVNGKTGTSTSTTFAYQKAQIVEQNIGRRFENKF